MHSVLENDKQTIDEGKIIEDSLNRGIGAFTPDIMFEQITKNYTLAKQIFGESLIKQFSGYDPDYVEKNVGIPEFRKELKKKIEEKIDKLKKDNIIDKDGIITDKGIELASVILYVQELDNIVPKGIHGERFHKKSYIYGDKMDFKPYKKGDRYKDFALKNSIKTAIRRGHKQLEFCDLKTFERMSKGEVYIVYGLDASGSMKGDKISTCKRAGVALAFKAIQERDKVGLIVFGSEVISSIEPTLNFTRILKAITEIKATAETNLAATIMRSIEMMPSTDVTKHLLLLTDALPTKGEAPEKETLQAASSARSAGITISIIGINLDDRGKRLAEKIAGIGAGKLYIVKDLQEIDKIVLEDYYSVG